MNIDPVHCNRICFDLSGPKTLLRFLEFYIRDSRDETSEVQLDENESVICSALFKKHESFGFRALPRLLCLYLDDCKEETSPAVHKKFPFPLSAYVSGIKTPTFSDKILDAHCFVSADKLKIFKRSSPQTLSLDQNWKDFVFS